jgi:isopentenyl-diphosphate delta-isomerase
VKEVGQGFGPASISALAALPLEALDYGAFGGTNFSKLENLRRTELEQEWLAPMQFVGHSAEEMTGWVNGIVEKNPENFHCKHIIVSGGISNYLDGYYHLSKLKRSSVYAQASPFLKMALLGEEKLNNFVKHQVEGLKMAYAFLTVK